MLQGVVVDWAEFRNAAIGGWEAMGSIEFTGFMLIMEFTRFVGLMVFNRIHKINKIHRFPKTRGILQMTPR